MAVARAPICVQSRPVNSRRNCAAFSVTAPSRTGGHVNAALFRRLVTRHSPEPSQTSSFSRSDRLGRSKRRAGDTLRRGAYILITFMPVLMHGVMASIIHRLTRAIPKPRSFNRSCSRREGGPLASVTNNPHGRQPCCGTRASLSDNFEPNVEMRAMRASDPEPQNAVANLRNIAVACALCDES
jgi:hypothetical protein